MNKIFQKFIIVIIIIGLISSINFNLIFIKPKTAQALDGGGSWLNFLKETALDAIGWIISDMVLNRMATKIQDWGAGKTSDTNEPFFMADWKKELLDIADIASARFVNELNLTALCAPIRVSLDTMFNIGLGTTGRLFGYREYAACTVGNIIDNVEEFWENPSIQVYGWDTWTALMQPQNNIFGSIINALQKEEEILDEETQAKEKEIEAGQGAKNETICNETDTEACKKRCSEVGPPSPDCLTNCEKYTIDTCLQKTVKNFGANIKTSIDNALGKDMQRIINADEITELVGIFFSAILNKAIDGMGLNSQPKSSTPAAQERAKINDEYSYLQSFKKGQTAEEKKSIRNTILTNILGAVRQLNKSLTKCKDEDEMMSDLDFAKNVTDVSNANLEALYVAMEGANLKPDFQALDPLYAPFTVFGYGWGEVPSNKIPEKCKNIITKSGLSGNSTCKNIISGLEPKKPTQAEIGFSYTGNCSQCMNDYDSLNCPPGVLPPQPYPASGTGPFNKSLIEQKNKFYNFCVGRKNTITLRCDECTKKADEKCDQTDVNQKKECIKQQCNNFTGIAALVNSTITDGEDFYNKCLIKEKNDACYVCLKEYYIPANYCDQVNDYLARSIVKYPTPLFRISDNDGHFVGPYDPYFDEINGGSNECNNDEDSNKPISLSLICRIMPDYTYDGVSVCKTRCFKDNMTTAELENIADFRPNDKDCGNYNLPIGGEINVWNILKQGQLQSGGKCCAAAWQNDEEKYSLCIGAGESGGGSGGEACREGEIFIGGVKTTQGKLFACPDGNNCYQGKEATSDKCRRGCSDLQFTVPNMENIDAVIVETNPAPGGSIVTVAPSGCGDGDESSCVAGGNCDYVGREPNNPVPGDGPGGVCQMEVYNSTNSESCCASNPQGRIRKIGKETMTCDFSDFVGKKLTISVVSNDLSDCKTSSGMCVKE